MQTIYYSIGFSKPAGKHIALALCLTEDKKGCWIPSAINEPTYHSSYEEALTYVTQIQKNQYAEYFGINYQLVYVNPTSEEWYDLLDKWTNFTNQVCNKIIEYNNRPWYKVLYHNIINRLQSALVYR